MRPFRSRFVTALAAALLSFALFGASASACGPGDPGVPTLCAGSRPAFVVAPPDRSTFTPGDPGVPGATSATPSDPGVPGATSATPGDPGIPN